MVKKITPHAATAFLFLKPFFTALILPLIPAVIFFVLYDSPLVFGLQGLLGIGAIVYSVFKSKSIKIYMSYNFFKVLKGTFIKSRAIVRQDRLQAVKLEQNPLTALFGLEKVTVYCAGRVLVSFFIKKSKLPHLLAPDVLEYIDAGRPDASCVEAPCTNKGFISSMNADREGRGAKPAAAGGNAPPKKAKNVRHRLAGRILTTAMLAYEQAKAAGGLLILSTIFGIAGGVTNANLKKELLNTATTAAYRYLRFLPPALSIAAILLLAGFFISFLISFLKCFDLKCISIADTCRCAPDDVKRPVKTRRLRTEGCYITVPSGPQGAASLYPSNDIEKARKLYPSDDAGNASEFYPAKDIKKSGKLYRVNNTGKANEFYMADDARSAGFSDKNGRYAAALVGSTKGAYAGKVRRRMALRSCRCAGDGSVIGDGAVAIPALWRHFMAVGGGALFRSKCYINLREPTACLCAAKPLGMLLGRGAVMAETGENVVAGLAALDLFSAQNKHFGLCDICGQGGYTSADGPLQRYPSACGRGLDVKARCPQFSAAHNAGGFGCNLADEQGGSKNGCQSAMQNGANSGRDTTAGGRNKECTGQFSAEHAIKHSTECGGVYNKERKGKFNKEQSGKCGPEGCEGGATQGGTKDGGGATAGGRDINGEVVCGFKCNTRCKASCGGNSAFGCVSGYEGKCTAGCTAGCEAICGAEHGAWCNTRCKASCGGNSAFGCVSGYEGKCTAGCTAGCEAICGAEHGAWCNTRCKASCGGNSAFGCVSGYEGKCTAGCTAGCEAICGAEHGAWCNARCKASCRGECAFGYKAGYKTKCEAWSKYDCSVGCTAGYKIISGAGYGGGCNTRCRAGCGGNSAFGCVSGYEGKCTAGCTAGCEAICGAGFEAGYNAGCKSGCKVECVGGRGAVCTAGSETHKYRPVYINNAGVKASLRTGFKGDRAFMREPAGASQPTDIPFSGAGKATPKTVGRGGRPLCFFDCDMPKRLKVYRGLTEFIGGKSIARIDGGPIEQSPAQRQRQHRALFLWMGGALLAAQALLLPFDMLRPYAPAVFAVILIFFLIKICVHILFGPKRAIITTCGVFVKTVTGLRAALRFSDCPEILSLTVYPADRLHGTAKFKTAGYYQRCGLSVKYLKRRDVENAIIKRLNVPRGTWKG